MEQVHPDRPAAALYRAQDDLATFEDFLAECCDLPSDVSDPADRFMWEVAEKLGNPGLALNAAFQSFCANAFDLLTPDRAAGSWCSGPSHGG